MNNNEVEQEKEKRQAIIGITRISNRIQKKIQEKLVLQRKLEKVKVDIVKLNRELDKNLLFLQSTTIENSVDVVD